jgi:ABC-2 type transport system permease protein
VGLLISTVATTQIQSMMMSFMFTLPAIILSGFMFPRDAMPQIVYWLSYLVPLTYFLEVIRGIVLKGSEIGDLWNQVGLLALYGAAVFAASAARFRKSLG